MKSVFSLVFCVFSFSLLAQSEADCRIKEADMQPIIERFNPFFSEHIWVDFTKQESAKMDKNRYLTIRQEGCKRHHKIFTLYLSSPIVTATDSFWVQEAKGMFWAVYYGDKTFRSFQQEFEEKFEEKLAENGVNKEFNFPVGTRNFLCEVEYTKEKEAALHITMVEFGFETVVKEMRKPNTNDDGWFVAAPPKGDAVPNNLPTDTKKKNNKIK